MSGGTGAWATMDHYLRVAFGDPQDPDFRRAQDLAAHDVHEPVRVALAELGRVEVLTEPEDGETGCCYQVVDSSVPDAFDAIATVAISTVLPYAAITVGLTQNDSVRYLTEVTEDVAGQIVDRVRRQGLCLLPSGLCRALSPVVHPGGERLTYYAALFGFQLPTP